MKKHSKRSMAKILLVQAMFFLLTALLIIFSLNVFKTALELFVISDNIHFIEESGRWTEGAHEAYDEMIAARRAVKNESIIGYVLVTMGSSGWTQVLRLIILVGLFVLDCLALYVCYQIIKSHIKHIYKKIKKLFYPKRKP